MKRGELPHVAVLVDTATGWGRRIIRGIFRYSDKNGPWYLTVEPRGPEDNLTLPPGWNGHGVIARLSSQRVLRALQATGLPVVNVSAMNLPDNQFPQVTTDYHESASLALQHFRDRGLQRFGYSGLPQTSFGRRHRDAFVEVVKKSGYSCDVYQPPRAASRAGHEKLLKHKIA